MTMPSALRCAVNNWFKSVDIDKYEDIRKIWEVFHGFNKMCLLSKVGEDFLTCKVVMMKY